MAVCLDTGLRRILENAYDEDLCDVQVEVDSDAGPWESMRLPMAGPSRSRRWSRQPICGCLPMKWRMWFNSFTDFLIMRLRLQ
jgi:hypothetical protein